MRGEYMCGGKKTGRKRKTPRGKDKGQKIKGRLLIGTLFVVLLVVFWMAGVCAANWKRGLEEDEEEAYFSGKREEKSGIIESRNPGATDVPYGEWFGCSEDRSVRLSRYLDRVHEIVSIQPNYADSSPEALSEEEKEAYNELKAKVDILEENKRILPPGGGIPGLEEGERLFLTPEAYWEIAVLRKKLYLKCPCAAMIQQVGRNAADALTVALRQEFQVEEELWKYAGESTGGYTALLYFLTSDEAVADICYWIGDIFYQLALHMDRLEGEEREHCYLAAYAFFYWGLIYAEGENVDHGGDLVRCLEEVSKRLSGIYGY